MATKAKRRYGVFCGSRRWPRYTASTKREALRLQRQADKECQAKAQHPIMLLADDGSALSADDARKAK